MLASLRSLCLPALLSAAALSTGACAAATDSTQASPAPTASRWPDPTFSHDRQCRSGYTAEDLERYLARARLALSIPSTRSVMLDQERRCITVVVEGHGGGRLAELVIRGVAVPRDAVVLRL